jgi:methyl-accepting chemotaxis protein
VVEATEDIRNRIAEIQEATNNMVIASENNMKSIAQGLQSMQETTGSLEKILASARRTTEAAKQIALSTQQQKTASDQVAQSLQEVADGARHFVHTVEETNKVAGELSDLSKKSMELIGRFKLDGGAAG